MCSNVVLNPKCLSLHKQNSCIILQIYILVVYWHLYIPWKTFSIHGIFSMHKIIFIMGGKVDYNYSYSLDYKMFYYI